LDRKRKKGGKEMSLSKIQMKLNALTLARWIILFLVCWLVFFESLWPVINNDPDTNGKLFWYLLQAVGATFIGYMACKQISAYRLPLDLDLVKAHRDEHKKRDLPYPDPKRDPKPKPKPKTEKQQMEEMKEKIETLEEKGGEK